MSFQPIENYGIIGNQYTAALVGLDSSIDFFCFPEFDSPTIFCALLDAAKGGSFSVRPMGFGINFRQMYVPDTNVLTTRFLSGDAVAELTDFMPIGAAIQKNQIVRILQVIRGSMSFEMLCEPAFNYARTGHTLTLAGNCITFFPGLDSCAPIALYGSVPLEIRGNSAYARLALTQGDKAIFILGSPEELACEDLVLTNAERAAKDRTDTVNHWRQWIRTSQYRGRWREAVNRSALILKLMVSRRYGSLVAAPTFGLPEHIGGSRNWDYRFVWIRDAAFTLYSFMRLGLNSEADQFFGWLKNQIEEIDGDGAPLQIMYGLNGHRQLYEEELSYLSGYRSSRPVRIGNGAFDQLQLDIYGELLDAVYLYSKYGHAVPYEGWLKIEAVLLWLGDNWDQPDKGIWEVRGENQHLLHSRLMCWVAFDRAIRLAHKRSHSAPLETWYQHRDAIAKDIHSNFWNSEMKAFTQGKGGNAMDGSVLLMPLLRFISPLDPRWLSTLDAVERTLSEDAFVYRYRATESSDGLDGEEGSFTCCSFWFVECLARSGQIEKAHQHFERILTHANHLGLFSEEIGRDGGHLGNFPQALSHLSLISAATFLDRALSGERSSPWSQ